MQMYKFVKRNPSTGNPEVVATVEFSNGAALWKGDKADEMRAWLLGETFLRLPGEKFDEASEEHWKSLPGLASGSYFWVAKIEV